jgi:hypothetical protein
MKCRTQVIVFCGLILAMAGALALNAQVTVTTQSRPLPSAVYTAALYPISGSASGSFIAIPGVAGSKIQVVSLLLTTATNTTVEFTSTDGVTPRTLTGPMTINGLINVVPWGKTSGQTGDFEVPLFETDVGKGFGIVTGAATQVSGQIKWTASP